MTTHYRQHTASPFAQYQMTAAYNEMFDKEARARSHHAPLYQWILDLTAEELDHRQPAADLSFLNQGITFTIYGRTDATERIFLFDLLPRTIAYREWRSESTLRRFASLCPLRRRSDNCAGRIDAHGLAAWSSVVNSSQGGGSGSDSFESWQM